MPGGLDGGWPFDDRRPAFSIPLNCSGFQGMDATTIDPTQ